MNKRTYAAISVFGGRVVFSLEEWEEGDLIGAAAMRLHCRWVDVLTVEEVQKNPETMQEIVAKIRELAKTGRLVTELARQAIAQQGARGV